MNLSEMKITGTNTVTISNALSAPVIFLKLKSTSATTKPDSNVLEIIVTNEDEQKKYDFLLSSTMDMNDTFIIEPIYTNGNFFMKTSYNKSNDVSEELTYQEILLYEGTNIITTNYPNIEIELFYSNNTDLGKYFINSGIFYHNKADSVEKDIYFKDAFTQDGNNLNLNINHLNVDCITSSDNKFSLDANGNLEVNSIITSQSQFLTINDIYPIDSIYLSINNVNPGTFFGGTWEQIAQGRTLVGVDTSQSEFNVVQKTGGNKVHAHHLRTTSFAKLYNQTMYGEPFSQGTVVGTSLSRTDDGHEGVTLVGGWANKANMLLTKTSSTGQLDSTIQPYYTCYIWLRKS